jgi:hypothetical protein
MWVEHRPGRNAAKYCDRSFVGHDALACSALCQVAAGSSLLPVAAPTMPRFARAWKAHSRKWTIASVHSGGALLFRGEMPTSGAMPEHRRFPPPWSTRT